MRNLDSWQFSFGWHGSSQSPTRGDAPLLKAAWVGVSTHCLVAAASTKCQSLLSFVLSTILHLFLHLVISDSSFCYFHLKRGIWRSWTREGYKIFRLMRWSCITSRVWYVFTFDLKIAKRSSAVTPTTTDIHNLDWQSMQESEHKGTHKWALLAGQVTLEVGMQWMKNLSPCPLQELQGHRGC